MYQTVRAAQINNYLPVFGESVLGVAFAWVADFAAGFVAGFAVFFVAALVVVLAVVFAAGVVVVLAAGFALLVDFVVLAVDREVERVEEALAVDLLVRAEVALGADFVVDLVAVLVEADFVAVAAADFADVVAVGFVVASMVAASTTGASVATGSFFASSGFASVADSAGFSSDVDLGAAFLRAGLLGAR